MKIRAEQLAVFERVVLEGFVARLIDHWKGQMPRLVESLAPVDMSRLAMDILAQAQREGLESEREIVIFADLLVLERLGSKTLPIQ